MDTELNVSWEAESPDRQDLIRSIRRVRGNLLAEHTGLRKASQRRALNAVDGLVAYLNSIAGREGCRLRRHTMESFLEDVSWIKDLMPEDLAIDPERPVIEESIYELISRDKNSIFAKGILLLNELALPPTEEREKILKREIPEQGDKGSFKMDKAGRYRWYILTAVGIVIAAIAIAAAFLR